MNHEARMKMYHKLLENKNYRKLKKLEDLKQFLDANEYKYIENNIDKYKQRTFLSQLFHTLFNIDEPRCPVCGEMIKFKGFKNGYMLSCVKCGFERIDLYYSTVNEPSFNLSTYLKKVYRIINYDKILSFRKLMLEFNFTYTEACMHEIYLNKSEAYKKNYIKTIFSGCPVYKICHSRTPYIERRHRFGYYCSIKCASKDPEYCENVAKGIQKSMNENKDEIIAKRTDTQYKRYGDLYIRTDECKEKIKETSLKNWGTEHPSQSPEIKEKMKMTCRERYDADNYFKSDEFYTYSHSKFGTKYPFQSAEVQMKIKENRYQGDLIPGTKEYNLEVYGTENPEEDLGVKHMDQYYDKEFIESKFTLNNGTFDFQSYLEYFNITEMTGYTHKKKLGIEIPNRYTTQGAIVDFIKDLGFEVLENDRKTIAPMELDIYIPEKNLAVEYHGLMFHSVGKSKYSKFNNHGTERAEQLKVLCHKKANLCDQKGIKLLQIFENEWLEHEEIWKSIIKKELGIYETVSIEYIITREIDRIQAQEFLESNWIYDINYTSSQALLYAGNIVALILTDQNGYTRIIEHRDYRILNLDKILKGKKVLVDRRIGGLVDLDRCAVSKFHLEPKCYGFNENNIILQETIDSQFAIDQGNRVIWDAGYIVLEF